MNPQDDRQLGVIDHMAGSDVTAVGYLTGPGLFEQPVTYAVVDGRAIYDGCIDMGAADEVAAQAEEIAAGRELRLTTAFAAVRRVYRMPVLASMWAIASVTRPGLGTPPSIS